MPTYNVTIEPKPKTYSVAAEDEDDAVRVATELHSERALDDANFDVWEIEVD
jgi:hypothetical protein